MSRESTVDIDAKIEALEKRLNETRNEILKLRKERSGETVQDFELTRKDGSKVRLSELFGDKSDLIVVHNMGRGCAYCTLWADGFNGVHQHLSDRAGFALVSHDDHQTMKEFTEGRGWEFTCLSGADSDFTQQMGFLSPEGKAWPGFSTFRKSADGKITRVGYAWFGPGDDYCAVWHMFDLLADGQNEWGPQYKY